MDGEDYKINRIVDVLNELQEKSLITIEIMFNEDDKEACVSIFAEGDWRNTGTNEKHILISEKNEYNGENGFKAMDGLLKTIHIQFINKLLSGEWKQYF